MCEIHNLKKTNVELEIRADTGPSLHTLQKKFPYIYAIIDSDFMPFLKDSPQHAAKYSTHNSLSKIRSNVINVKKSRSSLTPLFISIITYPFPIVLQSLTKILHWFSHFSKKSESIIPDSSTMTSCSYKKS